MATLTPQQVQAQFKARFAHHYGEGNASTGDANTAFANESYAEGYGGGGGSQEQLDQYFTRRESELGLTPPGSGGGGGVAVGPGLEAGGGATSGGSIGGGGAAPGGAAMAGLKQAMARGGAGDSGGPVGLTAPRSLKPLGQRIMPDSSASLAGIRKIY
jgi:hypothetical protein